MTGFLAVIANVTFMISILLNVFLTAVTVTQLFSQILRPYRYHTINEAEEVAPDATFRIVS